jgi:hypothetical protein
MFKRFRLDLPSPALVLSMLALIAALGGTSFAAGSVSAKGRHDDVKQDKALIKKMAKNLKVKYAKKAGQANLATNAAHATNADSATHATSADSATNATNATTAANSNQLQGLAANQLVRASGVSAGTNGDDCSGPAAADNFQDTTFTNLVTKTVTAPVAGELIIIGKVSAEYDAGSPAGSFMRLRARFLVDGAGVGPESESLLTDSSANCKEAKTMSLVALGAVAAGDHTVNLQVAKSAITGGTGLAWIGNAAFVTLFEPFANDGTQGTGMTYHPGTGQGNNR